MTPRELGAGDLRRRCDPQALPFSSTAEAPELDEIIGQERATRAIDFGINIHSPGYNIFAIGPAGAGKTSTIIHFLQRKAATRPMPPDWGYVHNFAAPDRPLALRLPPGGGARLRERVDGLLAQVAAALAKTFAGDQYAASRSALERDIEVQRKARLEELEGYLHGQGFDVVPTEQGLMLVPFKDGRALTREQFEALTDAERQELASRQPAAEEALEHTLRQVHEIGDAGQARLAELDQQIVAAAVGPLFAPVAQAYADWPDVSRYLAGLQDHMAGHAALFKAEAAASGGAPGGDQAGGPEASGMAPGQQGADGPSEQAPAGGPPPGARAGSPFDRYRLNLLVDNQRLAGAPVVLETNPTYANLIGRVEGRPEFGTLVTDYRYVKAGALHRANGGYLVLDARALLSQPLAWEGLKQALRHERIRIEDMGQQPGVLVAATLTPEPIPLDVKVVLIGDSRTYYTLYAYDPQFETLFKVRADFAVEMDWTPANEVKVSQFIRARCDEENLAHFDVSGVARVIEICARLVEDQRRLTTRFGHVNDLVREAAYWATRAGHALVTGEDVDCAIAQRIYRSNQYEERVRDFTREGAILIDTSGAVVGQVNGLAVIELGDYAFGRPARITAQTFQGRAGVVNIEREAKLSGRIHDKGVLILTGFLGGRYAQEVPLSLSASVAFEQSYEGVDGDSASSTELYALLSSLSGLPIRQSLAVTGSVNQRGDVQAIGGATLKVEGFFDICRTMPAGLTGEQGVILPRTNVASLMLRDDVVAAVAAGQFHIYAIETVDEGIELLTGVPAGARGADGRYPAGSVNALVEQRLRQLSAHRQQNDNSRSGPRDRGQGEEPPPAEPPHEPALPADQAES
jgi:lon-related putative ATP-dependent protease